MDTNLVCLFCHVTFVNVVKYLVQTLQLVSRWHMLSLGVAFFRCRRCQVRCRFCFFAITAILQALWAFLFGQKIRRFLDFLMVVRPE